MDDKSNADILNRYFTSVYVKEEDEPELILNEASKSLFGDTPDTEPFEFYGTPVTNKLEDIDINIEIVYNHLKSIDAHKSTTPECIHPRILKECASTLAKPLFDIFSRSIATGMMPSQWKRGTVTPLHKGDSRHDACNYRPITITSLLCRILEKNNQRIISTIPGK